MAVTGRPARHATVLTPRQVAIPSLIGPWAARRPKGAAKRGHGPANAPMPTHNSEWSVP